ncbi:hypothetical protein CLAFUW4_00959 [Fulvia fulva]|uniref:SMP domain-containing protein n=1 Tax=Passalora fulva TaxID=5499 RepID=A0A9Q8L8S7_PASFU|nr:uncharacterized protein CLAFUR5_00965 [Fulvia fulva]KAK4634632.1 hypothetical protein CLAFUR4_00960 [Fulvia fulva]KAK4636395.1 hypothetical protein CLAFUR0_00961 [Fulvia fulva]UJO12895.1 hypothetical protein CLAFUR5_00965 [Fulvia fulva]WPV08485.1 hypothetical protein CLAFUW4_00959 [Fulvia fulva]WPV23973.1 hypothetical protein CLAFUW7_00857 [Fulvia fulva]
MYPLRQATLRCVRLVSTSRGPTLKHYSSSGRNLAQTSAAGEQISQTAKAEGGPAKGAMSAEMQSQVGKARNFEQAAQEIGQKMQSDPAAVSSEDAAYLKSREARAIGQGQPPADSISADAQRLASMNEGNTKLKDANDMDPAEQSAADRIENFENVAEQVAPKLATNPEQVTKDEADLLHSREQRAFGNTSKGGVASQAQSAVAENETKGSK